jgi:hypothetical protein
MLVGWLWGDSAQGKGAPQHDLDKAPSTIEAKSAAAVRKESAQRSFTQAAAAPEQPLVLWESTGQPRRTLGPRLKIDSKRGEFDAGSNHAIMVSG